MNERLASWLDISIEERTEFNIDKVCYIHFMVIHIVLHYSKKDYANSTFILESTLQGLLILLFDLFKISISALTLHQSDLVYHLLKFLLPKR